MYIQIEKAIVLQSIGFALTSAREEHERVTENAGVVLRSMLSKGELITDDMQKEINSALTKTGTLVDRLKRIEAMAEFASPEHGVMLDEESFELLQRNLPGR